MSLTPEQEAAFEKCVTPPGDCDWQYDPRPDGQRLLKEVRALRAKVAALREYWEASQAVQHGIIDFDLRHGAPE